MVVNLLKMEFGKMQNIGFSGGLLHQVFATTTTTAKTIKSLIRGNQKINH